MLSLLRFNRVGITVRMQRLLPASFVAAMNRSQTKNSVRIIGGELRSRRIDFPSLPGLRPTGDRIRETLFNWLQGEIRDARCLDLFAGSGVLGFEAASRGASTVRMLDHSPEVVARLEDNVRRLQLDRVHITRADSLAWLEQASEEQFDIVFVDPPFAEQLLVRSCAALATSGKLAKRALLYLESAQELAPEQLPQDWTVLKSKKSGAVYYYLLQSGETAQR